MKNTRKFLSILMAAAMTVGMALNASAYTIDLNTEGNASVAGHTYMVYQIFTGDLSEGTLSNIKYGANYGKTGKEVPSTVLDSLTDAEAFAKELLDEEFDENDIKEKAVATLDESNDWSTAANDDKSIDGVDLVPGYYLIVDTTKTLPDNDSYSAYIVKVVKNVTMAPKSELTTADKVIETDDYLADSDANITNDGKQNNAAIGTEITFKLTARIPANADDYYSYYYCVLNDKMSEGLTFDPDSVVVGVDNNGNDKLDEGEALGENAYKLYTGTDAADAETYADGYTFQIAMLDAQAYAGKTIIANYTATVNEYANIGVVGNPNEYTVTYSNNPNFEYAEEPDDDTPGKPDDKDTVPTGETPEKETRTYTTGIELFKVDDSTHANPLAGAEFTLTGANTEIVLVSEEKFTATEAGEYYKLLNGEGDADDTYTKTAPVAEHYELAAEGADAGYVWIGEGDVVTNNTDAANWKEYNASEDAGKSIYVKVSSTEALYEKNGDAYATYNKTTVLTQKGATTIDTISGMVDSETGVLTLLGLGEGTYTISETETPAGFNTIKPFYVTITWVADDANEEVTDSDTNCGWTAKSDLTSDQVLQIESGTTSTEDNVVGVFQLTVVNEQGSNLPETGSIGTVIFYVAGGIMVAAAVIFLVTKKRMNKAEN